MSNSPRAFVIGHPIAHSRSPLLHGFWLRAMDLPGTYEKVDVAPEALADFVAGMASRGFVGGNVTVPHKTAAMGMVRHLDAAAQAIGAVNTLWFEDGALWGGNTDAAGFLANLDAEAPGWDSRPGRAVVLGAGGAARAVVHGLLTRGFRIAVVNRSAETARALADQVGAAVEPHEWDEASGLLEGADLLVNTTALGMAGKPPLDLDLAPLKVAAVVSDIVYVPLETGLLRAGRSRGHRVVDGLGMLLHQAAPGFERWFGTRPSVTAELRAFIEADLRRQA